MSIYRRNIISANFNHCVSNFESQSAMKEDEEENMRVYAAPSAALLKESQPDDKVDDNK